MWAWIYEELIHNFRTLVTVPVLAFFSSLISFSQEINPHATDDWLISYWYGFFHRGSTNSNKLNACSSAVILGSPGRTSWCDVTQLVRRKQETRKIPSAFDHIGAAWFYTGILKYSIPDLVKPLKSLYRLNHLSNCNDAQHKRWNWILVLRGLSNLYTTVFCIL